MSSTSEPDNPHPAAGRRTAAWTPDRIHSRRAEHPRPSEPTRFAPARGFSAEFHQPGAPRLRQAAAHPQRFAQCLIHPHELAGQMVVGRTLHHANRPTVIPGDPIAGRLTISRGKRGVA